MHPITTRRASVRFAAARSKMVSIDSRRAASMKPHVLTITTSADSGSTAVPYPAFASAETALSAIRDGAYDYMIKPFKVDQARAVVRRALEKYLLVRENFYLKQALGERKSYGAIIGKSEAMTRVFDLIDRVDTKQVYEKSDLLQTLRLLKTYDLVKDSQMNLLG